MLGYPLLGFWHHVPLAMLKKTFVPPWHPVGPGASPGALERLSLGTALFGSPCEFQFRTLNLPVLRIYEPAARLRYLAGVLC